MLFFVENITGVPEVNAHEFHSWYLTSLILDEIVKVACVACGIGLGTAAGVACWPLKAAHDG